MITRETFDKFAVPELTNLIHRALRNRQQRRASRLLAILYWAVESDNTDDRSAIMMAYSLVEDMQFKRAAGYLAFVPASVVNAPKGIRQ